MRLAPRDAALGIVLVAAAWAAAARSDQVTGIAAFHRSGQTFVTWTCPPGTGWNYRVYSSNGPIATAADFSRAQLVRVLGDSTAYDRRLSSITGVTYGYRVDSLAPPLDPAQGLYVGTVFINGARFYAVTAQHGPLEPEDRTLVAGDNTLTRSVLERVGTPDPVFQRVLTNRFAQPMVYTLWTSETPTPNFPAMANVPGIAFDCSISPRAAPGNNPLLVGLHARGGDFLQGIFGTGRPGEWVLSLDDPLFNADLNTFWYGYHEDYDIAGDENLPPSYGGVRDYTMQRVIYTLQWAERKFSIDKTRVYAYGFSMGGIGSVLLALRRPDLIAGVMTVAAKFDFSFIDDPNALSGFNPGNGLRQATDRLWGEVPTDLPSSDGVPVYRALNDGWVAGNLTTVAVPPIIAFNGKNDLTVGWAEKIPFYSEMQRTRHGGYFFWDPRDHMTNSDAPWSPSQDSWYLYRFRTNRSFPALSDCSADGNPGDGRPESGDAVGCINCWVEWDTTVVDRNVEWGVRLWTRDLPQQSGWVSAPESVTVNVTPRRLQEFTVAQGVTYRYTITREADGAVIEDGFATPDEFGLLTLNAVKVYHSGTRVRIEAQGALDADDAAPRGGGIRIGLSRNPVRGTATLDLWWPAKGAGRVDLVDVSGRVLRALHEGPVASGPMSVQLSTRGLADGVYFVVANQAHLRAAQRVVVLH